MLFGLLTGILVVTHIIPLLLIVAAILWIALLLFDKIVPYLPLPNKDVPPPISAPTALTPVKPAKSTSILGATKTRIAPIPTTKTAELADDKSVPLPAGAVDRQEQDKQTGVKSEKPETTAYDNSNPFRATTIPGSTSTGKSTIVVDNSTSEEKQQKGQDDVSSVESDDDEKEPGFDDLDPTDPVIPATMASQLPPPPAIEYEPLHMDPDAVQHYPLSSLDSGQVDPPSHPVEQYARRLKTVRTAAFDIARVVRNKQRNQSAEQLSTQFLGLIEHYQLLADMNVKRIIDQAHERSRQTYDEHIELFFRIQNACISGELEPAEDETDDEREGNHS
ncbi:hypothetical protein CLV58_13130 [Spirosoma oryzae]|uniref:Uncharacterized protein n=1 Tax=Spirosoma oryzae TaxID=1469603 RepID=A0A2T0S332_9BACT|nr:hypothetical protein [Spirosoma oryzae]PRY27812.1 hypothetical protein CLV58_13130 [Spirosoma oryzae]